MPDFSTTKRDLMPEAFSMNSDEEGVSASSSPAAMASALVGVEALGEGVVGGHQLGVRERVFGGVQAGGGYDGAAQENPIARRAAPCY